MGKSKEEDKIEKIIRGLLKLPQNRRCINCNSLGPQYVCTTFWTFVCTNCSGVHREFTHRVKSVSMAKFTSEEVSALQAGGNEQARQIYFKTWDPVRHGFPESGNINRLRDFLKHVYVDRKFTSEGPSDKLPGLRLSDRDDSYDCHGLEERSSYHGRCVDKSTRFYFSEGRSPRYYRETSSPDSNRRIPSRIEVANNRHKDVDAAVLRRSATQMFTTADIGPGRSPVHSKNRGTSSPPVVRHVREVLGEKFLALRVGDESRYGGRGADVPAQAEVGDHPRPGDSRNFNGSALAHKAAPSSTKSSGTHVLVNDQSENSESCTDARRNPRPDDTLSEKQMQQNFVARDCNNLVTSEPPENQNTSVPKQNTLEFLLFELSSPAAAPTSDQLGVLSSGDSQITRPSGNLLDSLPSDESHASDMVPTEYMPAQPHNYGFLGASSVGMSSLLPNIPATFSNAPAAEQASGLPRAGFNVDNHVPVQNSKDAAPSISSHTMVPTPSFSGLPAPPASISTPTEQLDGADPGASTSEVTPDLLGGDGISGGSISDRTLPGIPQDSNFHLQQINVLAVAANNQEKYGQARTPLESNVQGNSSDSVPYSQSVSTAAQNESSGVRTQHSAAETKSNGRKELPADFFTSLYPSNPTPPQGWQTGPHYGMSFNMHSHPAPMEMPGFPNASMSRNPFDLNDKTSQAHPPIAMFPSMTSLHGALPNVSAPAGISTSNFGSHNPVSEACMRQPPFSTMEQHQFNTMPLARLEGVVGFGVGGEFKSLDSNQQPTYGFSATTKPNSFPTRGGNPFG